MPRRRPPKRAAGERRRLAVFVRDHVARAHSLHFRELMRRTSWVKLTLTKLMTVRSSKPVPPSTGAHIPASGRLPPEAAATLQ
jgi:hypothetical protein